MIYVTSDLHFDHSNVIDYSDRPYEDEKNDQGKIVPAVIAMNEGIVANYNAVVLPTDTIYILGDIVFTKHALQYLKRLNGHKFLISGNHDKSMMSKLRPYFEWTNNYYELKTINPLNQEDINIVLFHYPIASWNKAHLGSWHLHGHSHGKYVVDKGLIMDVGIDTNNMKPYSLVDVAKYMSTRERHTPDHNRE